MHEAHVPSARIRWLSGTRNNPTGYGFQDPSAPETHICVDDGSDADALLLTRLSCRRNLSPWRNTPWRISFSISSARPVR